MLLESPNSSTVSCNLQNIEIGPATGWRFLQLRELWRYRELIYFLVWRDVKVRYKQTLIGIVWVILQPVMTVVIFTAVFGAFAKIPSDGLPYSIFAYSALLPWNYFSQATSGSGTSLVGAAHLISKVYFPRLIVPISAVVAPLVDFGVAFIVLIGMMLWHGIGPTWATLALPLLVLLALLTALAIGVWLSALNVRYRDVGHAIPFLIQFWMYASPVVYPLSVVPESWRPLYSLNPMVGVIEGFRWALLGKGSPDLGVMVINIVVVATILLTGLLYFARVEETFADVV